MRIIRDSLKQKAKEDSFAFEGAKLVVRDIEVFDVPSIILENKEM